MTARVQNSGLANITNALVTAGVAKYLQWGTGSAAAATANTVTTTGTAEARTAGTLSQQTTTVTNDTVQVVGTITATASRTISEVGVFDAAGTGSPPTGGNMDFYGDFTAQALNNGDSIAFTVQVKFQ